MKKLTGIYKITNKINGKIYIGSAVNIYSRWNLHKFKLKNNKHHSIKLQRAQNKYGLDNFIFEIVEECPKNLLIEREQYWIDNLKTYSNGYNCNPIAGSPLGFKHSEESRKKFSEVKLGKKRSEETKKRISESMKGKNVGRVTWNKGRKISEEHKKKISEGMKGDKNPNYGKKLSEETKKKMSKSKSGENNPMYIKKNKI